MLFGDSYKRWQLQFEEYVRIVKARGFSIIPISAWKSKSEWIGWGGLKWCEESSFQEELNREGVQDGEPDNKNPRKYSDMKFVELSLSKLPI